MFLGCLLAASGSATKQEQKKTQENIPQHEFYNDLTSAGYALPSTVCSDPTTLGTSPS